ncbi:MAG: ATP-binding protein [Candidatus Hodarchaeota archaeon]
MKIAIASGKGGTGKTTVATNLAINLDQAQLLDCDVEEPNSYLFLQGLELKKIDEVSIQVPLIDENKCDFCRKCAEFCEYNALAVVPSKVLFFPELCKGCGGCSLICPQEAISEGKKTIGIIEAGQLNGLNLFHGILNLGEPLATPIIKTLKKKADSSRTLILDSPPGTACPMIETVRDADYCILVTEPTPFGLHDLKIAVKVVQTLKIPHGIIINRDGIGDDRIEEYCQEESIPILMKIPNDRKIAHFYSKGIPFSQEMPEWKEKFRELLEQIKQELTND